ncbi:hypothetical protein EVAR_81432_1 [Eumeta japonica]|uniref:Uncharacterized protein n=1 Tax=Eumeta variegata TaxID=151549 RepID=A0A4C1VZ58_EUMVA|nr:hypothetical protein EVAR_81432_1 [Eumeta japonica]
MHNNTALYDIAKENNRMTHKLRVTRPHAPKLCKDATGNALNAFRPSMADGNSKFKRFLVKRRERRPIRLDRGTRAGAWWESRAGSDLIVAPPAAVLILRLLTRTTRAAIDHV